MIVSCVQRHGIGTDQLAAAIEWRTEELAVGNGQPVRVVYDTAAQRSWRNNGEGPGLEDRYVPIPGRCLPESKLLAIIRRIILTAPCRRFRIEITDIRSRRIIGLHR